MELGRAGHAKIGTSAGESRHGKGGTRRGKIPMNGSVEAGNGAPAADTTCKATICVINEMVVKNKCESCPAGKTNVAGDDACMADNQGTIDRVCNQCVDGDTDNVLCSKQTLEPWLGSSKFQWTL